MQSLLLAALLCAALFTCPAQSAAQPYPAKPIRLVTPYAAGGGADATARTMSRKLSDLLRQAVVVDNRPGAGATLGADIVAKSSPDGHTLLLADTSHAITASAYKRLPYDAVADFAAVSRIVTGANILVVHPSIHAASVAEFIAHAKANPGKLNYGSAGNGSPGHMAMELFKTMSGIDITHVPYKGAAPATADLLSGRIHVMSGGMSAALPQVRAGKLRALAVTSTNRSPLLPELPTISESGLPGYAVDTWFGLLAPSQTSAEIVNQLNRAVAESVAAPDVRDTFARSALVPAANSPSQFAAQIKAEVAKWRPVVRAAKLEID